MRVIAAADWSPTPLEGTTNSTGSIRLGILHLQDHSSLTASSHIPNSRAQLRHSQESSIPKVDGVQGRARSRSRAERKGRFFLQQGRKKSAFQDARRYRVLDIPALAVELHAPCSSAAGGISDVWV
ncbi:hypothetical protein A7C99_3089 [Trichophyton rubrum]|nr:hypothetical protein A7C99_3089 [Trichophyton rubrum]